MFQPHGSKVADNRTTVSCIDRRTLDIAVKLGVMLLQLCKMGKDIEKGSIIVHEGMRREKKRRSAKMTMLRRLEMNLAQYLL